MMHQRRRGSWRMGWFARAILKSFAVEVAGLGLDFEEKEVERLRSRVRGGRFSNCSEVNWGARCPWGAGRCGRGSGFSAGAAQLGRVVSRNTPPKWAAQRRLA